jgi:hypothetical protein
MGKSTKVIPMSRIRVRVNDRAGLGLQKSQVTGGAQGTRRSSLVAAAASSLKMASNARRGSIVRIQHAAQNTRAFLRAQNTGFRGKPLKSGFSIKETRGDLVATTNSRWMFYVFTTNCLIYEYIMLTSPFV